jgi:hypothetical protein
MNKRRRAQKASKAPEKKNDLKIVVGVAVLLAGLLGLWNFASRQNVQATQLPEITTAQTLPTATKAFAPAASLPTATSGFAPTVENKNTPARPAPAAMAWIPGGEFSMRVRRWILDGQD